MKRSFTFFTLFLTLLFTSTASAQDTCAYTLNLNGAFFGSWTGSSVTVSVNDDAANYNLAQFELSNSFDIPVVEGDTITVTFNPGSFSFEVDYALLDPDGFTVFEDGIVGAPEAGEVFITLAVCPDCPAIDGATVDITDIRAFQADVSWMPVDLDGSTLLQFGPSGFVLGGGDFRTAGGALTTLTGLAENTAYDLYLAAICEAGDTSGFVGPFPFMTLFANDVGVTAVTSPITGCEIGVSDSIVLNISNFGGTPQTLIPFNFSVNGVTGGVSMPTDGIYTGVLGTDSTDIAEFDAAFDTSEPGKYLFKAWTDLEEDSDRSNDTTELLLVNLPVITEYPYAQDFEADDGIWYTESEGDVESSWAYGTPAGDALNGALSGNNAWVTNPSGPYNSNERSFLASPCFDFSGFGEDPVISFYLDLNTESCCDELWLEASTDDGETWAKVGAAGEGLNWYNDTFSNWWDGNGGVDGWHFVTNDLSGLAGEPNVRLRFVLSTDFTVEDEGAAIDNIYIGAQPEDDLAAAALPGVALGVCGDSMQTVTIEVANTGNTLITNPEVSYSVNGGSVVTETIVSTLLFAGDQETYTFNQTFDSSTPGEYVIKAWADWATDVYSGNDTVTVVLDNTVGDLPFLEDFESAEIPEEWTTVGNVIVGNGHNNASFVLYSNLWAFNNVITVETPQFGPIMDGDTLRFDYRYVDFSTGTIPTILTPEDSLVVELSTNCGATYETVRVITGDNHIPSAVLTEVAVPLEEYVGNFLRLRLRGIWANGDYYLDIDNINIRRCGSLDLLAEVIDASGEATMDGSITVVPSGGVGPYEYVWSNGTSGPVLDSLSAGNYEVTVSDALGCEDILTVGVSITNTAEVIPQIGKVTLAPNPTLGQTTLQVVFLQPLDARIQVLNTMGQLLYEVRDSKVRTGNYPLDLSRYDSGMYFVRVIAGGQARTVKLIKAGQ